MSQGLPERADGAADVGALPRVDGVGTDISTVPRLVLFMGAI